MGDTQKERTIEGTGVYFNHNSSYGELLSKIPSYLSVYGRFRFKVQRDRCFKVVLVSSKVSLGLRLLVEVLMKNSKSLDEIKKRRKGLQSRETIK